MRSNLRPSRSSSFAELWLVGVVMATTRVRPRVSVAYRITAAADS